MTNIKCIIVSGLVALAIVPQAKAQQADLNLTLPQAIEIALAENPTIKVADKDIKLKEVADKEAWQSLLPTLDASLSLNHSIQVAAMKTQMGTFKLGVDGSTTAIGGLTLALPLFAPTVYQNMKLTKEDIKLAQEKARGSRMDLINQVTKAYYSALLSQDSRDVIQKTYNVAKQNYDIINNKFEVGSVSEYDKLTAEVQMRSLNSSLVTAEASTNIALLQLKVLMGVTADIKITLNDKLSNYAGSITLADVDAVGTNFENNSSLRQLDLNKTMLERTRKILKTNFMPTASLSLTGQYNSYSNENWNVFKYDYSPSATLAINISIPIFHISNWTKLKTNRIQIDELADNRQNAVNQLNMSIQSYRTNMINTIVELESDLSAVEKANKAVKIAEKRYEVGRGTILELNQSENSLAETELTYNQAIYDYLANKSDLEYTLGKKE